jgi:hypothetical protein
MPKVGSPRPVRQLSWAAQHASGPPSVLQCSGHVSQMRHTSKAPQAHRSSTARRVANGRAVGLAIYDGSPMVLTEDGRKRLEELSRELRA